jgi:TPR repeat protein
MSQKKHLGRYYFHGAWYSIALEADDNTDAAARFKKLGAQYDGPLVATVPGWVPVWMVSIIVGIRNFFL